MPWKETGPMDQRVRFIAAVAEAEESRGESFAAVCRRFGISRRIGYKWVERYDVGGIDGLKDRPRAPHRCPHRTADEARDALIELRKEFPTWGPKKLRDAVLSRRPELHLPAPSAIGAILKGAGLIRPPRSRYLLKCEGLVQPREQPVRLHFERAFREFGMPLRIRSDNGSPFASKALGGLSALSVWWIKLGILPERIEPGKPQQNGRHERSACTAP